MTLKHRPATGPAFRRASVLAILAQALLVFAGLAANAQEANRLQDIQVQSLPGQRAPSRW